LVVAGAGLSLRHAGQRKFSCAGERPVVNAIRNRFASTVCNLIERNSNSPGSSCREANIVWRHVRENAAILDTEETRNLIHQTQRDF
jgi:hypothetical protein